MGKDEGGFRFRGGIVVLEVVFIYRYYKIFRVGVCVREGGSSRVNG